MSGFSANLSMLFTEAPFLDRFDRFARAGFQVGYKDRVGSEYNPMDDAEAEPTSMRAMTAEA
jgi:hydroxypyruvate isomerase